MGGRWSAGAGAGRGPEHLLSLPQRPLLASEGTCSPAPGLGAPAALPPWCSLWALPRVGPRRPRAPGLGCSQVRTVTVPLAGGTVLGAQHAGSVSSCPEMAFRVGSGVRGQGAPQIQGRPHRQAPAAQPPHAAPHLQRRDGGSVNHTQPVQGGWDWGLRHRVQGGGAAHGEARARLESGRAPPPPQWAPPAPSAQPAQPLPATWRLGPAARLPPRPWPLATAAALPTLWPPTWRGP